MKKFSNHVYFKVSKKNDSTQKEREMIARSYPSWTESLIETESEIYVLNQVLFDKEQVKYYLDDYADRIENMGEFVKQYDVEQSAFGSKNVSNYLKKRNINKNYYFGITNANLHNNDDLIQVNFGV